MPFNNDDLKRLKEYIKVRQELSHDVPVHPEIVSFFSEVESLLARLEVSEQFIDKAIDAYPHLKDSDIYQRWMKSCGR